MRSSHVSQRRMPDIAGVVGNMANNSVEFAMPIDGYKFERCFFKVIRRIAERRGMNKTEMGKFFFPERKSAYHTFLALEKPTKSKEVSKPRGIYLREAVVIAEALELSIEDLFTLTEKEMKKDDSGGTFLNDEKASA